MSLAESLQRRLDIEDWTLEVFAQINSSGEASKFGAPLEGAIELIEGLRPYDRLRFKGLMMLAVLSSDEAQVRACFQRMRQIQTRLRDAAWRHGSVEELSMGMGNRGRRHAGGTSDFWRAAFAGQVLLAAKLTHGHRAYLKNSTLKRTAPTGAITCNSAGLITPCRPGLNRHTFSGGPGMV